MILSNIKDAFHASRLHEILHDAFLPYRPLYTEDAFNATVVPARVIEQRIISPHFSVYGAFVDNVLAGTVTTKLVEEGELYFMTMAVSPPFAGRGLGRVLLRKVEEEAKERKCNSISLDTYEPLADAIRLYEKQGFKRTGRSKDYSGIVVFEMKMEL